MGGEMSQSSCPVCCYPCVKCCCPQFLSGDKYPQVQYKTPEKANVSFQADQIHNVPLDKKFVFRQPKTEYSIHPQTSDTENSDATCISDQPRKSRESSKASSSTCSMPETIPTLEFSLYYDIQKNTLTIHLQQAYNLPSKSNTGGCNTCVVLYLLPNKLEMFESQVIRKCFNPEYDQIFNFSALSGPELLRKQTLVFRIFEYTRFSSRDLLGVVSVPLEDADLYGISTKMEIQRAIEDSAQEGMSGDMLFSLTYKPEHNTIQGIILRATNLRGCDLTGTRDPYVKVCLYHKQTRQHKWKSSAKKQTVSPVYNEQFQFDILNMNVENISLEFIVMDYDRFSRDEVVGVVRIGSTASEVTCRTHWEEVVGSPNHAVSRWHKLVPLAYGRLRTQTF